MLTAAAGLAHADGSDGSAAPAASKKIPEEQPVPTTPLIIAGVALAAFAILLLVGRRTKHRRAQQQPERLAGDLAEVRLVIETDESAVVTTHSGIRVSTDRLGEAVLNLPVGTHEVTIEVGAETFQRSIQVPSVRKMRMPINLTKERISRASSGQMPVIAQSPIKTSAARAYPDSATQSELGTKLAGLIDVELDAPSAPRKPSSTKVPLNLDYSAIPAPLPSEAPVLPAAPAPGPLELDVEEELDLQLPADIPATAMQLPPQPARPSALAGAPPSAPEQRPNPLRDVVVPPRVKTPSLPPRVTKAERQQAANAVADFAVDGLVAASPAELSIGPIPDLDLAPPTQQARAEAPQSYVDIGDFAIGELGEPQPALELELPTVTAASVADLELDLPVRAIASEPRKAPTPDINDFELTPDPAVPRPARTTRSSIPGSGSLVGNRYRKTGGAGAGVLGALYRGRDENAERDVWIEELPREATLSVPAAQLAKLEHPNIMRFYDHVTDATKSYLITELVEGKSLEQLISELGGVVSSLQAIAIVDQVCAALGFAHQHGIFHRNVRPACVWISGRTARLTGFGLTYGKPTPYQAPELAGGTAPADVRSDLYSVGMVLAQLLTGTVPTTGTVEFPPDVPRNLVGMIRKLISREAMIRPAHVKLVRDAFSSMF